MEAGKGMLRDNLSSLNAETEVFGGFTTKDVLPAAIVFLAVWFFLGLSKAIVAGGITMVAFQLLKKQLGDADKVYEFFRYLGRPKYYRRMS